MGKCLSLYDYSIGQGKNDLLKEWDYSKNIKSPKEYAYSSEVKVWWVCFKRHNFMAQIKNRAYGRGCPIYVNKVVIKGINDLATIHSDLLKEWDFDKNSLSPFEITNGSQKKFGGFVIKSILGRQV